MQHPVTQWLVWWGALFHLLAYPSRIPVVHPSWLLQRVSRIDYYILLLLLFWLPSYSLWEPLINTFTCLLNSLDDMLRLLHPHLISLLDVILIHGETSNTTPQRSSNLIDWVEGTCYGMGYKGTCSLHQPQSPFKRPLREPLNWSLNQISHSCGDVIEQPHWVTDEWQWA